MFYIHQSEVLKIVCQHNPMAIAVFDMEMRYLFASELYYERFCSECDDIIGKSHFALFPEVLDRPDWMEVQAKALKGESFTEPHDLYERKDGTIQYLRWAMKPWFRSDTGVQGGVVFYAEDVTEQRLLVLEKERLFNELKKEIAQKDEITRQLVEQATKDPLTKLFNRRYFDKKCSDEVNNYHRYGNAFSVVLFDIDYFKRVNDDFSHDEGDKVLVKLAKILAFTARETDVCARWGGEEFIVLMPNTVIEDAAKLAERLREKIESTNFPNVEHITISLGVSGYSNGKTIKECIQEADKALYKAKESGRNAVVVYD